MDFHDIYDILVLIVIGIPVLFGIVESALKKAARKSGPASKPDMTPMPDMTSPTDVTQMRDFTPEDEGMTSFGRMTSPDNVAMHEPEGVSVTLSRATVRQTDVESVAKAVGVAVPASAPVYEVKKHKEKIDKKKLVIYSEIMKPKY